MPNPLPTVLGSRVLIEIDQKTSLNGIQFHEAHIEKPNIGRVLGLGTQGKFPCVVGDSIVFEWFDIDCIQPSESTKKYYGVPLEAIQAILINA